MAAGICQAEIAVIGLLFSQMHNVVAIVIIGGLVTLGNYWMTGIFHTYNAEIYATRIHTQDISFNFSWSRISAIFVGYMVSALLSAYGTSEVFAMIAGRWRYSRCPSLRWARVRMAGD